MIKLSTLLDAISKVRVGIWQFVRLVLSANRDYPYHDHHVASSQTTNPFYIVGSNQIDAHGAQHKLFVSKSTLVFSNVDTHVHFNDSRNVAVAILAATWYTFYSDIAAVYFPIPDEDEVLLLYFEGVLPEEARSPE
jgi:hypothetical protein